MRPDDVCEIDASCRRSGGKSGLDKRVCDDEFVLRVPVRHMVRYSGETTGECNSSLKLNPPAMEVAAAFLMKALRSRTPSLCVNTFDHFCEKDDVLLFTYPKLDLFARFIKTASAAKIVATLRRVFRTLDRLYRACQFTHGDMKCDQVLLARDGPVLNDFDKSSFTVIVDGAPLRVRPKMGNSKVWGVNLLVQTLAELGVDKSGFNAQMRVRAARCPRSDARFDKACLLASTLLQVGADSTVDEILEKLPKEADMLDVECIMRKRRRGGALSGNRVASECLVPTLKKNDSVALKSSVRWDGAYEFRI